MGRGKTDLWDQFASVLGVRRGVDRTAQDKREIDRLLAAIKRGNSENAAILLRKERECPQMKPADVEMLTDALLEEIAKTTYQERLGTARRAVDHIVGDGKADFLVLEAKHQGIVHIWPEGNKYVKPAETEGSQTACGQDVAKMLRVKRGAWQQTRTVTYSNCPSCGFSASQFPETEETESVFPAYQEPAFILSFEKELNRRFPILLDNFELHRGQNNNLKMLGDVCFIDALYQHSLERLQQGGDVLLRRVLGQVPGLWESLQQPENLSSITRKSWEALTRQAFYPQATDNDIDVYLKNLVYFLDNGEK